MNPGRAIALLFVFVLAALLAAALLHLVPMPSLAWVRGREQDLAAYGARHPVRLATLYVIGYAAFATLPLPGAELLTIGAGAVFGLVEGILLASFAATIGSCGAFLFGRFLFRDAVQRRLGARFAAFAYGIEREGAFYLFALRLMPAIPFFVINVAMGATSLRLVTFYWVSQLGMLPAVIAYVNAGREMGHLESLSGILSPGMLVAFAILGLLPLAGHRLVHLMRRRARGHHA